MPMLSSIITVSIRALPHEWIGRLGTNQTGIQTGFNGYSESMKT